VGPLLLAATPAGIVRLAFDREDDDAVLAHLAERVSPRVVESPARLDEVRRELDEYFAGRRDHFELPIDWRLSGGFRKTVLERLYAEVGYGRTVSYLELATMVGNPKASRAVGTAMATNPIPIVVPCHRVLRTGGQLGGYGGGLDAKVRLLQLESGGATLF
jgi:methylated-DNA-[protein]-cysteine S-methyltransferase